jgi:hypothetical protein
MDSFDNTNQWKLKVQNCPKRSTVLVRRLQRHTMRSQPEIRRGLSFLNVPGGKPSYRETQATLNPGET